jgi:hypothetical protein
MSSFEEQEQTAEKTQKRVPNWKKLLSLKYSSSEVPIEYKIEGNEETKELKKNEHADCFKIIEKKRKSDKSKVEVSKKEHKKDKHKKKKQKADYEATNDEKDCYSEYGNLSKRVSLEKKVTDDSNSVLVIEQTKLKIPEEFTRAAKAG